MLKVKTFLAPSSLEGIGLFAGQSIEKGTTVWELNSTIDICFTENQWEQLKKVIHKHSFSNLEKYKYKEKGQYYVCIDNAQFMNHHSDDYNIQDCEDGKRMIASRLIKKGEELLCNYLQFCDQDDSNLNFVGQPNEQLSFL